MARAGPSAKIEKIEKLQRKSGPTTVYNFTVEGFHTYFVGAPGSQLWVHNATNCTKRLPDGEVPPTGVSGGHWTDVGWDPDRGEWFKHEAEQAHWLEETYGLDLRRVQPQDGKSGDWMTTDGSTSYDGVGGGWRAPGMDPNKVQPDAFIATLIEHLRKQNCDYVVVDLIGLPDRTRDLILDWINHLPPVDRDRIILR